VTNADVQYYVYKQRYYHWWWDNGSSDEFDDEAGPDNEGGDEEDYGYYGSDMVTEGEGQSEFARRNGRRFRSAKARR
jgi:hypothetical protein